MMIALQLFWKLYSIEKKRKQLSFRAVSLIKILCSLRFLIIIIIRIVQLRLKTQYVYIIYI